jgi:hypothetical protein
MTPNYKPSNRPADTHADDTPTVFERIEPILDVALAITIGLAMAALAWAWMTT